VRLSFAAVRFIFPKSRLHEREPSYDFAHEWRSCCFPGGVAMKRTLVLFVSITLLLVTAHRLPAPIVEETTPTPAPQESAKPKPKRITKPKVTTKFAGTWTGTIRFGPALVVDYTLVINSAGSSVQEKSAQWGSHFYSATCDGKTVRWQTLGTDSRWALTPNPDGKTALVTGTAVVSPVIFHERSP